MNRFIDTDFDYKKLPRFEKLVDVPLLPLDVALESVSSLIDYLDDHIKQARDRCRYPSEHCLTRDESASIYIFAMETKNQSLGCLLNRALRSGDQQMLEPWLLYLRLFCTALDKLPTVKKDIWRGVPVDISKNYIINQELIWQGVSSCSSSVTVIKTFLDSKSTLCSIETLNGKDVRGYTPYAKENEVLLPPGTRLCVKSNVFDRSSKPTIVYLKELSGTSNGQISSWNTFMSMAGKLTEEDRVVKKSKKNEATSVTNRSTEDRYEGAYKDNQKHGYGICYFSNGSKYTGFWSDDEPNGHGVFTWPNGNQYEGKLKDGKMHDFGHFHGASGDEYDGDFVNGKANGHGFRTWPDGDRYRGYYKDDKKHGYGTYHYATGGKYEGDWAHDEPEGRGVQVWPSGSRYDGEHRNGKRHGHGTLTFANGHVQKGIWIDDLYID